MGSPIQKHIRLRTKLSVGHHTDFSVLVPTRRLRRNPAAPNVSTDRKGGDPIKESPPLVSPNSRPVRGTIFPAPVRAWRRCRGRGHRFARGVGAGAGVTGSRGASVPGPWSRAPPPPLPRGGQKPKRTRPVRGTILPAPFAARSVPKSEKNWLHFSICACHPCAGAMLIFSVSFQF